MATKIIDNMYLINAPAGSGKTYTIKKMITEALMEDSKNQILCITYTNRAANELKEGIESPNIFIGTIHSFMNTFISIYFSNINMLNLYFEFYGNAIKKRIANCENKNHITEGNQKYIDKYGKLDIKTIKSNITHLSYNESEFSSLYYGQLSHDDLLTFSKIAIKHFPTLKERLRSKYQIVFIDEYQDTSTDALSIFIDTYRQTNTKVYLFGDKMQQIYRNYDGSLEEEFKKFNTVSEPTINYRSVQPILTILNGLYNDPNFKQNPDSNNKSSIDYPPRVLICNDMHKEIDKQIEENPDTLILFVLNQERFDSIGAGQLYRNLSRTKKYHFPSKYNIADILSDTSNENPDPLIRLLFSLSEAFKDYSTHRYGKVIQKFKNNRSIFSSRIYNIQKHSDKQLVNERLEAISKYYNDIENKNSIRAFLKQLIELDIVLPDYLNNILEDEDYGNVLNTPISEFRLLSSYLDNPTVSTQHGVKGESHNTVLFVAEDSYNPNVAMYSFFELWSTQDLSLPLLENLYYELIIEIVKVEAEIGQKISSLNKETYMPVKQNLINAANTIIENFKDNVIFQLLCQKKFQEYIEKPVVTKAKDCFKTTKVYGILSAYRLFYVGCSRARKNLTVLLDRDKIKGDCNVLAQKFTSIGFEIKKQI